jgi:hypothetical protein
MKKNQVPGAEPMPGKPKSVRAGEGVGSIRTTFVSPSPSIPSPSRWRWLRQVEPLGIVLDHAVRYERQPRVCMACFMRLTSARYAVDVALVVERDHLFLQVS